MNVRVMEKALHEIAEIIATRVAEIVLNRLENSLGTGEVRRHGLGGRRSEAAPVSSRGGSKPDGRGRYHRPVSSWQKAKIQAVLKEFRAGTPPAAIAVKQQVGISTVYRYLQKHGLTGR
jgi:hypothetical protein